MKWVKSIRSYLSLKFIGTNFLDTVSGKMVCNYIDCYGDIWMKDSRWSFFKVKKNIH